MGRTACPKWNSVDTEQVAPTASSHSSATKGPPDVVFPCCGGLGEWADFTHGSEFDVQDERGRWYGGFVARSQKGAPQNGQIRIDLHALDGLVKATVRPPFASVSTSDSESTGICHALNHFVNRRYACHKSPSGSGWREARIWSKSGRLRQLAPLPLRPIPYGQGRECLWSGGKDAATGTLRT